MKNIHLYERNGSPRSLEVEHSPYYGEDNAVERDEAAIRLIGPKGRLFGVMYASTEDLVEFAQQVISTYTGRTENENTV